MLLRLLNDLLRRLSKPSRTHLVLSGRILSLLGSVFPLGERSGVNLRGEFNVGNTTRYEVIEAPSEDGTAQATEAADPANDKDEEEDADKDADPAALAAKDDHFYTSFWSLQQYFANPPSLLAPAQEEQEEPLLASTSGAPQTSADKLRQEAATTSSRNGSPSGSSTPQHASAEAAREGDDEEGDDPSTMSGTPAPPAAPFDTFRATTRRIMDVFSEASTREKELEQAERAAATSSGSSSAKKRKREEMLQNAAGSDVAEAAKVGSTEQEGAFPKYLTGRRVFEYQLRNPAFRRHVLLQYLILFQYLLTFNPQLKAKSADWKNKQLLLAHPTVADYTLSEEDEQWIRKSWREIITLLEETGPTSDGRKFKNAALQTLRRETRWIQWKTDSCPAIDKAAMPTDLIRSFQESTSNLLRPRTAFPHSLGTAPLSELWEEGLEPIVPGTRRGEDAEGMEVELQTDGLEQLELPPGIPSIESYAKLARRQEALAEMRKRKLGIVADDAMEVDSPTDPAAVEQEAQNKAKRQQLEKTDPELVLIEERKTSLNWRALRLARGDTLRLWGKIEGGDVDLLLQAEKAEAAAKEKALRKGEAARTAEAPSTTDPSTTTEAEVIVEAAKVDAPIVAAAEATEEVATGAQEEATAPQEDATIEGSAVDDNATPVAADEALQDESEQPLRRPMEPSVSADEDDKAEQQEPEATNELEQTQERVDEAIVAEESADINEEDGQQDLATADEALEEQSLQGEGSVEAAVATEEEGTLVEGQAVTNGSAGDDDVEMS